MNNQKILYYRLSALIRVKGKYLLVRAVNDDGSGKSGYHLPGTNMTDFSPKKRLASYFSAYFDGDVEVRGGLEPIERAPDVLYTFLCVEKKPLLFPEANLDYGFFSPKETEFMNVVSADRVAMAKAEHYLPLLLGKKRVTPFTPGEVDKVDAMIRSLHYFHPRMPLEEAKQFEDLANSEISYKKLLGAYKFLLEEFDLNYFEFVDRPSKKRKDPSDL
ncbi:MAG: hypothetical protein K6B65_01615 [Bacilli bacterium]|nr:hypothetical protein [Bacilli bacterium]